ncbi:MAG TPA: M67 family metallopeptidase [Longimicrobiales bacterium]|nr:M67 family metallopeptidase [Longimicrobiales bacterium]
MARYSVNVPPRVLAGLRRHAAQAATPECCGALFGTTDGDDFDVRALVGLPNEAADPARYRIDARTVQRVEGRAAGAGVSVVGFYHSHPVGPAVPSTTDLELACPGYLYLIVEAATGAVRAWRLAADRSGFAELVVTSRADAA